jgi:hypothetical protein
MLLGYIKVMCRITDQATPVLRMFFVCVMGRRECQERGKGGKVCSPSASYSDQAVWHGPLVLAYRCLVSSFALMKVRLEAETEEKYVTLLSTLVPAKQARISGAFPARACQERPRPYS